MANAVVNSNLFLAQSPVWPVRPLFPGHVKLNGGTVLAGTLPVVAAPPLLLRMAARSSWPKPWHRRARLSTLTLTDALLHFSLDGGSVFPNIVTTTSTPAGHEIDIDSITNVVATNRFPLINTRPSTVP